MEKKELSKSEEYLSDDLSCTEDDDDMGYVADSQEPKQRKSVSLTQKAKPLIQKAHPAKRKLQLDSPILEAKKVATPPSKKQNVITQRSEMPEDRSDNKHQEKVTKLSVKKSWAGQVNYYLGLPLEMFYPEGLKPE